ncbi:29420_t:CDS:2, partial [Racocetra persica]
EIDNLEFVSQLQIKLWSQNPDTLANVDSIQLQLWRVNIPINDENKLKILETSYTNIDVEEKLDGLKMLPTDPISNYFNEQFPIENTCINIIVQTEAVNWDNKSIFTWIQYVRRSSEIAKPKFVESYGAKFPLQGRDETIEILFRGTMDKNGICQRFQQRKTTNRYNHPIPILANGPGAGKSRFLQELPTLLCDHVEKYTDDNFLINSIKNRMLSINITFGDGTIASDEDNQFLRRCGKSQLKIIDALEIILMDVDVNKNDDDKTNFIVIGIDELNHLHNRYGKELDPQQNPVLAIVQAAGRLNCSCQNVFYLPILAGTIQGPLEEMFIGSTYLYLHLPLRLLHDEEVWNISENIANTENLAKYINKSTFRRCISDLGGQVRALEIFYNILSRQVKCQTNYIDYVYIMSAVKNSLKEKYPFVQYANAITPAILNYIDLSSRGVLNLEPTHTGFYVRMPYMWVWILTSFNKISGNFWDVMIDQNPHVYWQEICISAPSVDSIKYQILDFRFPNTVQNLHLSPGIVYKNGAGAPWNLFFFLDNYLFVIQIKYSDVMSQKSQVFDERMLNLEYDKVKNAFNTLQNSFEGEFPIKNWVLLICTNGQKTSNSLNSLPNNCFVVDCENFKDFYGYTFSSRAEFSAANDTIDVNTAEDYELKTIKGIGEKTAQDICNKRPFYDENDLYSKVDIKPESRKKIKVIRKRDLSKCTPSGYSEKF